MTNEEKFLCLLYLKTKNDPQRGFDSAVLAKLIGLQATNLRLLLFQLSAGEYLNTRQGFGNNLVIGTNGIQLARSLVVPGRVTILRFLSAKYLSPTNVAKHSVIFYYYVIVPDQSEANHSITVSATDIVANTWGKSYAAGQPGEQLLLLHGRDHIAQKLLRGDLQQHEDVEIRMQDLHHLPHYTLDDLVPVGEAEFLVEHPQPVASPSPIVASGDTAEILGNRIVRTKTTINVLFKAKYNEELFLQSELQNVLDLHKEATTEDAFYNRVISLGTTVGDLNLTILRKLSNSDNQPRSISLLSDFVQSLTPNVSDIIKPMRNITTLRNAYPAHKDKKETIDAYRGLGITPPVVHYSESWKLILAAYCKALESLRDLFLPKLGQQTP